MQRLYLLISLLNQLVSRPNLILPSQKAHSEASSIFRSEPRTALHWPRFPSSFASSRHFSSSNQVTGNLHNLTCITIEEEKNCEIRSTGGCLKKSPHGQPRILDGIVTYSELIPPLCNIFFLSFLLLRSTFIPFVLIFMPGLRKNQPESPRHFLGYPAACISPELLREVLLVLVLCSCHIT